jgi:hypothetical protein
LAEHGLGSSYGGGATENGGMARSPSFLSFFIWFFPISLLFLVFISSSSSHDLLFRLLHFFSFLQFRPSLGSARSFSIFSFFFNFILCNRERSNAAPFMVHGGEGGGRLKSTASSEDAGWAQDKEGA